MKADKDFLETYSVVLGIDEAIDEIRHEDAEKGIEKGIEKGREEEREILIMAIRNKMGFSDEQIANMTNFSVEYIQSVINKFERKKK